MNVFGLGVVFVCASGVVAEPIEYRLSGMATGSVDGVAFDGAFETITSADTDSIFHGDGFHLVFGDSTIELDGYGVGPIVDGTAFGATNDGGSSNVALLNTFLMEEVLAVFDPSLDAYDLETSFGPVTDDEPFSFFVSVQTGFGPVTFDEVSTMTFEAVIVPAPGTAVVLGVLGIRRRRVRGVRAARVAAASLSPPLE